jgi:alanine racemase
MPPSETAVDMAAGPRTAEPRPAGDEHGELDLLRPAWVGVDLDQLEANLAALRPGLAPARIMAVIKADAYGHGAPAVARALVGRGVDWLGVALVEEGVEVRRAGVGGVPILVLGTAQAAQLPSFAHHALTATIASGEQLAMWRAHTASVTAPQPIHLKVDTGMGRLGVPLAEVGAVLDVIRHSPGLRLTGLLSHLAEAEDLASARNRRQQERFAEVLALLAPAERAELLVHFANSAGALHHAGTRRDLVRLGLALYGLDPAGPTRAVRQVMSLAARIVSLRDVPAGAAIGYGGRWAPTRDSRVAVLPVGYADGYAWRLSNKAQALVAGRRVPVVGAVSMDMCFVDVTDTAARVGDPVVLMGRSGGEEIDAREIAQHAGTIPWETLCLLGLRLPRRYLRGAATVEVRSRFVGAAEAARSNGVAR